MGRKGSFTTTLFFATSVIVLPLVTEAQLAKRGTYASHFPWQIAPKSMPLSADQTLLVYEVTGTHLNDAGTGFLHGAAVVCYGMNDIRKGVANNRGHCTATDRDGDKAFAGYECAAPSPVDGARASYSGSAGPASTLGSLGRAPGTRSVRRARPTGTRYGRANGNCRIEWTRAGPGSATPRRLPTRSRIRLVIPMPRAREGQSRSGTAWGWLRPFEWRPGHSAHTERRGSYRLC
jgi:hypothetical protein